MAVMLVVAVGCVLGAPPNNVLIKHSRMNAHALCYVWIKTMHLCIPPRLFGKVHLQYQISNHLVFQQNLATVFGFGPY